MTSEDWRHRLPLHYAWLLAGACTLTVFACLGLGRFALGMLLPSMGQGLALSYAQMGWISTANFVGYFAAVLAIGYLTARWSTRRLVALGLVVVGAALLGMGLSQGFWAALTLFTLAGVGSGLANISVMALLSHWFSARHRGKAAGIAVSGSGLAILLSGWLVPWVNAADPAEGWRTNWLILGCACLGSALIGYLLQRDRPAELGLQPVGAGPRPGAGAATTAGPPPGRRVLLRLGSIYFGFGFTYVIYATFIVTVLVQEHGLSESAAGGFWSWVGLFSLGSGPLFGALSDRLGRKLGLVLVLSLQALAYALAGGGGLGAIYLSIGLFGITAWSVPTIVSAAAADYLGPARAAAGLAFITLFFGVGQIAGPALAGAIAESAGSFSGAFFLAAAVAAAAAALALRLRPPAQGSAEQP